MSEQLSKILSSAGFIKKKFPKGFKPGTGIISENKFDIFGDFKIISEIKYENIPGFESAKKNQGKVLFAKVKNNDVLIFNGRFHYYDGFSMRDIGHTVYTMKYSGIKNLISIDETGHLNPRFSCGELALIYDHINLTGDNPLIGKNDDEIGIRFPDMSNAYDKEFYSNIYKVLQNNLIKINESVILGTCGPQSETDAEARFYRDAGADVVGYSVVSENIAAVHCGMKFAGIGLITRELVADKMSEDERSEKQKNKDQKESLKKAEKILKKVLIEIIKSVN